MIERSSEAWPRAADLIRATSRRSVDRALATSGPVRRVRPWPLRPARRPAGRRHGPPAQRAPEPDQRRPPPRVGGQDRSRRPPRRRARASDQRAPSRPARGGGAPGRPRTRRRRRLATSRELTLLHVPDARCRTTRRWRSLTRPFGTGRSRRSAGSWRRFAGQGAPRYGASGYRRTRAPRTPSSPSCAPSASRYPGLVRHPAAGAVRRALLGLSATWSTADRRIVIECDSWQWHGDRKGFLKDVRRYTLLVADGWTVLRFTWDDVMLGPAWVREVLSRAVGVDARTEAIAAWPVAA